MYCLLTLTASNNCSQLLNSVNKYIAKSYGNFVGGVILIKKLVGLSAACLTAFSLCSCTHDLERSAGSGKPTTSYTDFHFGSESNTMLPSDSFISQTPKSNVSQETNMPATTSKMARGTTSSKTPSSTTTQKTTMSTIHPLDVPLVFDDVIVEKLVREFVDKPKGNVYPRDFSDFIDTPKNFVVEYNESTNKTSFADWSGVGNMAECNGKVNSFKALSTIPFKYVHLDNISDIKYFCSEALESIRVVCSEKTENFKCLSRSKNLKSLYIEECKALDLSLLTGLQNIESITIRESEVNGFNVIKSFKKLKIFEISDTSFTDVSGLSNHPSLESLRFDYIPEMDLSFLLTMPRLKVLTVGGLERVNSLVQFPSKAIYEALTQKGVTIQTYGKDGWA